MSIYRHITPDSAGLLKVKQGREAADSCSLPVQQTKDTRNASLTSSNDPRSSADPKTSTQAESTPARQRSYKHD